MKSKKPTQKDVAQAAGVSRATVSYVMNGRADRDIAISDETRQKVLDVIAELGYEPDARAQSLRSGATKTIGVLLPIYENPYFWQTLRGMASEAEAAGYSLLLSQSSLTLEQERKSIKELAQQRVDGLILLIGYKTLSEPLLEQLHTSNRPIVEITSTTSGFDHVLMGYAAGTEALMEHLFELGHRRIGFVYGVHEITQGHDRLITYKRIMKGAGLPFDDSLVQECGPLLEDGYEATLRLLDRPDRPTALLVINDLLGTAAIRAAEDLGLRVPKDVSIASFDDIPSANFTVPRLTTVAGQPEQNGRDAVRLLLRRLNRPDRPLEVITGECRLIIRESTGLAPH